jgi:hypothetical protein
MANIPTLVASASYETLTAEISYTLVRCEARPITAGLAPALLALLTEVNDTENQERLLELDVQRAEIRVALADDDIDGTVDAVVNSVLTITGGDRSADLYLHFLGGKTPAQAKAPVLAEELELVRGWIPSLLASPYPTLAALGPVLADQVAAADKAKGVLDTTTAALKDFREVGARKVLADHINARRKATYGDLGDIVHSNPLLNLPKGFPDQCFLHEHRKRRYSSKELKQRRDLAQAALADLDEKIQEAEADEKAAADRRAEQRARARAQKLADAQKKANAATAALATLQAQPSP